MNTYYEEIQQSNNEIAIRFSERKLTLSEVTFNIFLFCEYFVDFRSFLPTSMQLLRLAW